MRLKHLYILIFLFQLVEFSSQEDCDVNEARKFDATMAKLLTIGNSGRRFPESKGAEVKEYCDDTKTLITQIDNYKTKCLKDLPKQVTGVIVYSIKNSINQLCKKDTKRLTELISSTPCMNKGSNDINKCYTKYIDGLLGAQNADDNRKIPHHCCEYYKIYSCAEPRLKNLKGCSEPQIDIGLDWVRSLFGNVMDLICNDYTENSDKCAQLETVPKKKKNQRRPKSFILPLVKLLSSFKEVE